MTGWSCILADCYQNRAHDLSLSIWVNPFSSQSKQQLTCNIKTLSLYAHLFIIQVYSQAENPSQISYFSSQLQGSFPSATKNSHTSTCNNVSNIVKPYLVVNSSQLPNSIKQVDLWLYKVRVVSSNNQIVLGKNYKNLIFHIIPIQTAMKKIITTIFSKIG